MLPIRIMKNSHAQQRNPNYIKNMNQKNATQYKKNSGIKLTSKCNYKTDEQNNNTYSVATFNNSRYPFIMIIQFYAWLFKIGLCIGI